MARKIVKKGNNGFKQIVVFGSNILDIFFHVQDFSLFTNLAPGAEDALHLDSHEQAPGGKGANQAVAAAKAGAKVHFFGAVGRGAHGRYIMDNFKEMGIKTAGILQDKQPTGTASIFVLPTGKHKVVVSQGANLSAKQQQVPDKLLGKRTLVLLQSEMREAENVMLARRAKKAGATVVVNAAPARPLPANFIENIDYLILNEPEAHVVASSLGHKADDLVKFAQKMAESFTLTCIVTLGERGAFAVSPDASHLVQRFDALPVDAKDTVGAGDALVGAFCAALCAGESLSQAMQAGVVAGSLACTKIGAQSALPSAAQIRRHRSRLGEPVIVPIP